MDTPMKNITLPVTGMTCAACAGSVETMLNATQGVDTAKVNFASSAVSIDYKPKDVSLSDLKSTVQSIGYDLIIEEEEDKRLEQLNVAKENAYRLLVRKTIASLVFTVPIMVIAMGFPDLPYAKYIMLGLTLPVILWSGNAFYKRTLLQLRHRMVTMDTLVALSTSIAFIYSVVVTLYPELLSSQGLSTHVYYEAAAVIISFVQIGKLLEERARSRTSSAIKELMKLQPDEVEVVSEDGSFTTASLKTIKPGTRFLIKPGDRVPLDGRVESGDSFLDESMITGESMPVQKGAQDKVFAGTYNQNGQLIVIAETTGSDTLLAKIIKMVQKAQDSKAEVQKLADKIAAVFVPIVLGISLLTFISWLVIGGSAYITYALLTAISVLVIACPCALGLATPTAIIVGIGRGAENNILIKDATALESLTRVTTFVFDKTGTITNGKPTVNSVNWHINNEEKINHYKGVIRRLEEYSDHPFSKAIRNYFDENTTNELIDEFENITGRGIKGKLNSELILLGNADFLKEHQVSLVNANGGFQNNAQAAVYFAVNGTHLASIEISDQIKSNAAQAIENLRNNGYRTWLLTGDNEFTASKVASEAGISNYQSALLPHDKAEIIDKLKSQGEVVAMIGDGINDSEALAKADVGIAMGSGSDIAMEVAQITLRGDDLGLIEKSIGLARQTSATIKQNLFWAFIYNLIGIPIAAGVLYSFNGFLLNPMYAAAAMALSSVSVVTNSLLLKRKTLKFNRKIDNKLSQKEMETYSFKTNINCNGCIAAVTPKLSEVKGIKHWQVDTENPDKILTVELENSKPEAIVDAVKSAGYTIEEL